MRIHCPFLARSAVLVAVVMFACCPAARAAVLPPAELDRLAEGTDYKTARAALNAVLALNRKADVAAPYDFVHIWTLLAKIELDQGHFGPAALAARKGAAEAQATGQVQDAAEAMAMSCLISRSRAGTYTARSGDDKGKQYSVVDPASRRAAYADLFADELDTLENDRWQGQCTTTVDPALVAADKFVAVRAVERVATGTTARTDQLGRRAATDARQIINAYIKDRNGDLADYAADAKTITVPGRRGFKTGHVWHPPVQQQLRGLTPDERKKVAAVLDQTGRIDAAVGRMNAGFGVPSAFNDLHKPATDLHRWADRLLSKFPG